MSDHRAIVECWEAPAGWAARGPFDCPAKGSGGPRPPTLRDTGLGRVLDRRVAGASPILGSYGMGGPGFFGLELEGTTKHPREWLVLRLWGADNWLQFDGVILSALPNQGFRPYGFREFEWVAVGQRLLEFRVRDDWCLLWLGGHRLEISPDPADRPPYAGNGKPRRLGEGESLWDAWVVSNGELFV